MLDRSACERRVYRLATVLTGDPSAALRVIEQVVGVQPDLRRLETSRLDRLTILRSREQRTRRLGAGVPERLAAALSALTAQQREAWVLTFVYQVAEREAAKAMDCSVQAYEVHLKKAEGRMREAGMHTKAAAMAVLRYSLELEVPGFYRENLKKRRRWRVAMISLVLLIGLAALATAVWVFAQILFPAEA